MPAFAPEPFSEGIISPETASLFRRTPYISPEEYKRAPTAVAVNNLVPGGSEEEQLAALTDIISRASDMVDTICFHRPDGTLAACPSTESAWVKPRDNQSLLLQCNFKPVLEVIGMALGLGYSSMQNIGDTASKALTINGRIIQLPGSVGGRGPSTFFPTVPLVNGRVLVVWTYVNGFPHTTLAKDVEEEETSIEVEPSVPEANPIYGVYPGTQLTIHDGAATEVVVVSSVEGLTLNLTSPLRFDHKVPTYPNVTRVSAVPWDAEQACILLISYLIKTRGSRAQVIPASPSKSSAPPKQAPGQAGADKDLAAAEAMLKHYSVPYLRSNA